MCILHYICVGACHDVCECSIDHSPQALKKLIYIFTHTIEKKSKGIQEKTSTSVSLTALN